MVNISVERLKSQPEYRTKNDFHKAISEMYLMERKSKQGDDGGEGVGKTGH